MNTTKETPKEAMWIFHTCFLINSTAAPHLLNEFGHIDWKKHPELINKHYNITCTDPKRHRRTKITVSSRTIEYNKIAVGLLKDTIRVKEYTEHIPFKLDEIPFDHCTICFKTGHDRTNCLNCSFCSRNHFLPDCPFKTPTNDKRKISEEKDKKKLKRQKYQARSREETCGKNVGWFQRRTVAGPEILEKLTPVGPDEFSLKPTLSLWIDTVNLEKQDIPTCICVSGWFGSRKGTQTLYFNLINHPALTRDPLTVITGIQAQDLREAETPETLKGKLLQLIPGKRVLLGQKDDHIFHKLGISYFDLSLLDTEILQTWDLFGKKTPEQIDPSATTSKTVIEGNQLEKKNRIILKKYIQWCKEQHK